MSNPYKDKKSSELTAEEIAKIRDNNSTKANMGEGKVDVLGGIVRGVKNAGSLLHNSVKDIVNASTKKTEEVRKDNEKRKETLKRK
jgi:isopentenyl phosphate kinase